MEIKYVYFAGEESFQIGDIVRILHKKSFENEIQEDEGVITPSILTDKFDLDCSEKYNSKKVEIDFRDIIKIEKI